MTWTSEEPATTGNPPDWLERAWAGAKRRGLDTMTPEEIDAEIAACRRERRMSQSRECDALKEDIAEGLDDIGQGRMHDSTSIRSSKREIDCWHSN